MKQRHFKALTSLLLVVVMLASMLPAIPVFAADETVTYTFSSYTAGAQYAENEEHVLDSNLTIYTTQCHFTTQLRIYSSSTNNGYAILKAADGLVISGLAMNAGNKKDTVNIYGSKDGNTWTSTPIGTVTTTATTYKDYSATLSDAYQYLKLDVAGTQQIRIASISVTFTEISGGDSACEHANKTTTTVDATCTTAGSVTVTCDDCDKMISTETIAAPGHTGVATCTSLAVCKVCGEEYGKLAPHIYEDGFCTECGAEEPDVPTYVLVTDGSSLKAGDKIVIVANKTTHAIGEQKTNNRGVGTVTITGNTLTIDENVQVITLEAGTTDGTFAFNVENGYLYAASSGSNHLKTNAKIDVNGSWTIVITDDGVASIVATASSNRNVMQYNPNNGSPLFSCYAEGKYTALQIYKLTDGETPEPPAGGEEPEAHEHIDDNADFVCDTCGEVLKHTHADTNGDYKCDVTGCTEILPPAADSILTIEQAIALGSVYAHNTTTTDKYYVTGTITEVYNTTYGNMYIKDENDNTLQIYGTYNDNGTVRYDALDVKPVAGDVVTVYGIIGQYNGNAQIKNGWITEFTDNTPESEEPTETETETETEPEDPNALELKFDDETKRTVNDDNTVHTWTENGITFINQKTKDSHALVENVAPVRLYKNSNVIITLGTDKAITKIVFNANTTEYATYLATSLSEFGTVETNGKVVTLTLEQALGVIFVNLSAGQVRLDSIKVSYIDGLVAPTYDKRQFSLGGSVTVNVTATVSAEWLAANPGAKVLFRGTYGTEIELKAGVNVYSYAFTPKALGEAVTFVITDGVNDIATKDVSYTTYKASMDAYIEENPNSEQAKAADLLDKIDNYTAAANGTLTGDLTDDYFNTESNWAPTEGYVFESIYANLGEKVNVRFSIDTTIDYTGYTVTVTLGETTLVDNKSFANYITSAGELAVTGLAPKQLNDTLTVTVFDANGNEADKASFSLNDYLLSIYAGANQATKNMIVATYQYGVAAEAYAQASNQ